MVAADNSLVRPQVVVILRSYIRAVLFAIDIAAWSAGIGVDPKSTVIVLISAGRHLTSIFDCFEPFLYALESLD